MNIDFIENIMLFVLLGCMYNLTYNDSGLLKTSEHISESDILDALFRKYSIIRNPIWYIPLATLIIWSISFLGAKLITDFSEKLTLRRHVKN